MTAWWAASSISTTAVGVALGRPRRTARRDVWSPRGQSSGFRSIPSDFLCWPTTAVTDQAKAWRSGDAAHTLIVPVAAGRRHPTLCHTRLYLWTRQPHLSLSPKDITV
jgi:hypothetical protein